jgi:hypothetical protein
VGRTVATAAALLLPAAALGQTLGDERAVAPDEAELAAIERAWDARESARLAALRRRVRPYVELGPSVLRARDDRSDGLFLRRDAAAAVSLALGVRYGFAPAFEVHGRMEAVGPLAVGAIDDAASARAATAPCAGTLRFDFVSAAGALLTLEAGVRARVFNARSPFYVGVGARLGAQVTGGDGPYAIRCVDAAGVERSRVSGAADAGSLALDVGAALETGYRFGDGERWDVGLRLLVHRIGTDAAGVAGAQVALGWSLR